MSCLCKANKKRNEKKMTTQTSTNTVATSTSTSKISPKVGDKIQLKQTKRNAYIVHCPSLQNLVLMLHVAADCSTEKKNGGAKQQFIVSNSFQLCENTKLNIDEQCFTTKSTFWCQRSESERFNILTSFSVLRIGYKESDKSESGVFGFDCRFDDNGDFVITNYEKQCKTTFFVENKKFESIAHESTAGHYAPQKGTIVHNERGFVVDMTVVI
jgi:hypothetical protein